MGIPELWKDFRSKPLTAIREWQNHRVTWLIMLATAAFLEGTAIWFQYGMGLNPCEYCVYQRLAILLLGLAALLIMMAPRNLLLRASGFCIWGCSAAYGLQSAILQIENYKNFNPFFSTCNLLPSFPLGLPLHEWVPSLFLPTGLCGEDNWSFLSLNMAQWMTFIFGIYLVALVFCLVSLLFGRKRVK